MKIRYRRTGGIANIKTQVDFDSEALPSEKLATLEKLLRLKSMGKSSHPDDFIHELEILDDPKHQKVRFADSRLPHDALALFDFLTQKR